MASQGPFRTQQLKPLEGVSRDELQAVVKELVEENPALAEQVNAKLDRMRETTGTELKAASKIELSVEQAELLEKLEAQYPSMKASLEKRKISTAGIPTWEAVKTGLTLEVLDKALKLAEPALNLIPPTTRKSKVEAIDKYKVGAQKYETATYKLEYSGLWNGGKAKTENKWRVKIEEIKQDVEPDPEINDGKKTNFQMATEWAKKLQAQGLDVMNDADSYLTLMMRALDEGKPLDPNTFTVLSAKNLTKSFVVAFGFWDGGRVGLSVVHPVLTVDNLRLRGSVGVDIG